MSKVLTDQIEKRTGGTAIDLPATGKWPQGNIADDAVGTAQLAATGTASATTFLRGDNSWSAVDTSGIQANKDDIALLAFKTQANGSLARYNLVDQSVDAFEDASGVDAGTSCKNCRFLTMYTQSPLLGSKEPYHCHRRVQSDHQYHCNGNDGENAIHWLVRFVGWFRRSTQITRIYEIHSIRTCLLCVPVAFCTPVR